MRKSVASSTRQKKTPDDGDASWPILERLSDALRPSWHETRTAGRLRRHTNIIRGLARELSNSKDRKDRPSSATDAQRRFDAHLSDLVANAPRAGLGAATGRFVDGLKDRYSRYGEHLFQCFGDPRIPATTNKLEGFFGDAKRHVRGASGCGCTTNSLVTNLGADVLIGYHLIKKSDAMEGIAHADITAEGFLEARRRLDAAEAPAIRQRSMVRSLDTRLEYLCEAWCPERSSPDG